MEAARNVILLRKSADDNSQATYSSARETPSTHMFIRRPRRSYSASAAGSTATTSPAGTTASPATGMGEVGAIGTCLKEKTTPAMVQELRDGKTDSATGVYRDCLETALPASLVAQAEPIIQQTADCGVTASKDLTDADVQKIESGDQETIQTLTQSTLACVSGQLGVPLQ